MNILRGKSHNGNILVDLSRIADGFASFFCTKMITIVAVYVFVANKWHTHIRVASVCATREWCATFMVQMCRFLSRLSSCLG